MILTTARPVRSFSALAKCGANQVDASLDEAGFRAAVEDYALRTGALLPGAAEWIGPLLLEAALEGLTVEKAATRIRTDGGALPQTKKSEIGLAHVRARVGLRFVNSLTARGRLDPVLVSIGVSREPGLRLSNFVMARLCKHDRSDARMLIRVDEKSCVACRAFKRAILEVSELPEFPLSNCDSLDCRCRFDRQPGPSKADQAEAARQQEIALQKQQRELTIGIAVIALIGILFALFTIGG
jgi:hypothetical protein